LFAGRVKTEGLCIAFQGKLKSPDTAGCGGRQALFAIASDAATFRVASAPAKLAHRRALSAQCLVANARATDLPPHEFHCL